MRVLVTDGDARSALAVTRSLGRAGHRVVVGERRVPALAHASRFCADRLLYPDPAVCEREFVSGVLAAVQRHRIDVVMPAADVTSSVLAEWRESFEGVCTLALPSTAALSRAADKVDTMMTAAELGIPIPKTVVIEVPEHVENAPQTLSFPVVMKPRQSKVRTSSGWKACSVAYAATLDAIRTRVAQWPPEAFPALLQERVEGVGIGVFLCCDRGHPVAAFAHRRLREKPPTGGVSVLCESIVLPPVAVEYATRLMKALGWHGVAMVEFKLDRRDGTPRLMEINGRFWGSLQLAIDAGVDFPLILLDLTAGRRPAEVPQFRVGVRSRWLLGDFDSLLLEVFGSREFIPAGRSRLRAVVDFLQFVGRDLHYENPRMSDFGPGLHEVSEWLKLMTRRGIRS